MARNPAYQKLVARFVTPNIHDRILAEDVDSDTPSYRPIEPGTPHPEANKYPDFVFAAQQPLDDGKTIRRFWINERLNQDEYNFERSHLDSSSQHPILTRTYVLPRDGYTPLADKSPDPVESDLVLIDQQQQRTEDPIIDSLFVIVRRVYAKLPGPALGGSISGDSSALPADFRPFVRVDTTQTKVTSGTSADVANSTTLSSQVVPESDNLATKTTETLVTSLPITKTGKAVVTEFGGNLATVTTTLKGSGSLAATPTHRTVSAQNIEVGPNKFREEVVQSDAEWPEMDGNDFEDALGINIPFTRQVIEAPSSPSTLAGKDAEPIDQWRTRIETIDNSAAAAAMDDFHIIYPSYERVTLPDKLISVVAFGEASNDEGTTTSGTLIRGSQWSDVQSTNSRAGAAIAYDIEEGFSGTVPAEIHVFFLPIASIGPNDILTKTTSQAWPPIKPRSHTVVVKGESVSEATTRSFYENLLLRTNENTGRALSFSTYRIPPTIHNEMTVDLSGTFTSGAAIADVNPATLPATNFTVFPTGRYLLGAEVSPFRAGYARVTAFVVNITSDYV